MNELAFSYPFNSVETRGKRRELYSLATRLFLLLRVICLQATRSDDRRLKSHAARDASFTCYGLLANLNFPFLEKRRKKSPDLYFVCPPAPTPYILTRSYPTRRVNSLLQGGTFLKKL